MRYEVYINMKNDNALCTISMLSAMLETQDGSYYSLLIPFVLYSLPESKDAEISVDKVTDSMREFGFVDFPHKLTETILTKLCTKEVDKQIFVRQQAKRGQKKQFFVNTVFDRRSFDASKYSMRKKIDDILHSIQKYFEEHFYHKTLPLDSIRDKLTSFFEANGFTVIKSVNDLRLISKETGSDSFEIAHFILEEYEKKSVVYDDLCEVTKGFLTYKGLYYFLSDRKNHLNSKFQDVTFYLDCSLVLDALNYDTASDYNAVTELIRLVRRCGGQVAVFRHTAEESARLIEAFANKPQYRNNFRLDNLAAKKLPRDILLAIAQDVPKTLKEKVQVDTVDAPSFSDKSNYQNILGEQEIVEWLTKNRQSNGNSADAEERYKFDAKSLIAVGMCRRDFHPHYIEQAKAIIVTQDPWLNKCLRDLYKDKFKTEVYYSITDTELVSLLWLQDHKQIGNLPSDILIANAHAACRVSTDVMDRAIQIANTMAENGIIPSDAALLVSSHADFKSFIADRVRNDATQLSDETIRSAVDAYIKVKADVEIVAAREEERRQAQGIIDAQSSQHSQESAKMHGIIQGKDDEINRLKKEIAEEQQKHKQETEEAKQRKYDKAEKKAKQVSCIVQRVLHIMSVIAGIVLILIFMGHCYFTYIAEKSWGPYILVDVAAFISVPLIFISPKSLSHRLIGRAGDWVYTKVYSWIINEA